MVDISSGRLIFDFGKNVLFHITIMGRETLAAPWGVTLPNIYTPALAGRRE
jgi:hypothetical protein